MILELPFPPSANTYWRHIAIGGRPRTLISEKGRAYRQTIIDKCRAIIEPLRGPLTVHIQAYPPDLRRRDVDNMAKALCDSLTHAGVWVDDSQITTLIIQKFPPRDDGACVQVEVTPA